MYKITNERFEQFLEKVSQKLGIQIDTNSFDYEILQSLFNINQEFKKEFQQILDKIIFENLKGDDLDNFLDFFNIHRKKENLNNTVRAILNFHGKDSFNILEGCRVKIDNKYYTVLKTTMISNKNEELILQKSFGFEIENQLIARNGSMIFDKNKVSSDTDIEEQFNKFYLISVVSDVTEQEDDFNLLERSKKIMQTLGFNNQEKIKYELLKDKRIKNVKITEEENVCNIIVYPKISEEIDEIIHTNKHIVDYYKDRNIELIKPNLITIDIKGLTEQIDFSPSYQTILEEIKEKLNNFLEVLYIDNEEITIKSNYIKNIILEHFKNLNNLDIDTNIIDINYNFYFRNNYKEPIYSKSLGKELVVNDNNIVSIGKVI